MNGEQFDRLMAQLHRMREGQDLGLGAIRDALQMRDQSNAVLAAMQRISEQLAAFQPPRVTFPFINPEPYFVGTVFEPPAPDGAAEVPDVAPGAATVDLRDAWMREAFRTVLEALDAWIDGAWENHGALDHRGETYPCWEQFHPQDIRNMVADAARQLKVELPEPEGSPRETMVGR